VLNATGGGSPTGSFTGSFTGSLLGTASWSNNSLTSSFVTTLSQSVIISGSLTVVTGSGIEFEVTNTGVNIGNIITDTHRVKGSLQISGSITGSLLGTASYATNSLTASFALNAPGGSTTGSFTGSFTGSLLGTSSWAESASFALTASYALNAGSGGNTQIYIDQSPDNGTYGTLTGSIDGSNSTFTVSQGVYISGTLVVAINGQVLTQGGSQDWTESNPSSGIFIFNTPPPSGSVLTTWYNKTVVVGANFTAGTLPPSGGNDGDIYLQYT
jgi:hypothetical protein